MKERKKKTQHFHECILEFNVIIMLICWFLLRAVFNLSHLCRNESSVDPIYACNSVSYVVANAIATFVSVCVRTCMFASICIEYKFRGIFSSIIIVKVCICHICILLSFGFDSVFASRYKFEGNLIYPYDKCDDL